MTTDTTHAPQGLRRWLSRETTSGILLLAAAALALVWANSAWRESYHALSEVIIGPASLHLNLSLATWAADGLLAIFFFTVGVELKEEIVVGSLSKPREAVVPVLAALGGMALPALIYSGVILATGESGAFHGWAIPTATDIAFALGVLAIFGRGLPRALRVFLLTLAVVDDLMAIIIIAVFYTGDLTMLALVGSLAAIAVFALVVRSRHPYWWILIPTAVAAWALMHEAGVHATIAGVLMGLMVPARLVHGEAAPRTHRFDAAVRPYSVAIALPIFAFFSAGVTLVDGDGPREVIMQPVVAAIVAGLVLGKLVGVLGTTWLVTRFTPLRLPDAIGIRDLLPVGFLTGIGFTVSLLIAELSFPDSEHALGAKIAVLMGSAISATIAAALLRKWARMERSSDMNRDGIEDTPQKLIRPDDDGSWSQD